jgi:hypothetical protein
MKRHFVLFALGLVLASAGASAQVPFVQAGIHGARLDGYTKPNPFLQTGIDYQNPVLTSVSFLDYQPFVSKGGVPGFGSSVGVQSLNYWRISKRFSLGGGASYVHVSTSVWSKSTVAAAVGALFDTSKGRVYVNYFRAVALDQNHNQAVKATWEIGSRRVRPVITWGVSHYTEPSYCTTSCVNHIGADFAFGVKFMLTAGEIR